MVDPKCTTVTVTYTRVSAQNQLIQVIKCTKLFQSFGGKCYGPDKQMQMVDRGLATLSYKPGSGVHLIRVYKCAMSKCVQVSPNG